MSYVAEWEAVKAVLDGWTPPTGMVLYGPNLAPEPPEPSSDPANPRRWCEWDMFFSGSDPYGHELGATQETFGGSEAVWGRLQFVPWQQVGSGDGKIREAHDSINALFFPAGGPLASGGLQFYCPDPGDPVTAGNYYGRPMNVYFRRTKEHG